MNWVYMITIITHLYPLYVFLPIMLDKGFQLLFKVHSFFNQAMGSTFSQRLCCGNYPLSPSYSINFSFCSRTIISKNNTDLKQKKVKQKINTISHPTLTHYCPICLLTFLARFLEEALSSCRPFLTSFFLLHPLQQTIPPLQKPTLLSSCENAFHEFLFRLTVHCFAGLLSLFLLTCCNIRCSLHTAYSLIPSVYTSAVFNMLSVVHASLQSI